MINLSKFQPPSTSRLAPQLTVTLEDICEERDRVAKEIWSEVTPGMYVTDSDMCEVRCFENGDEDTGYIEVLNVLKWPLTQEQLEAAFEQHNSADDGRSVWIEGRMEAFSNRQEFLNCGDPEPGYGEYWTVSLRDAV